MTIEEAIEILANLSQAPEGAIFQPTRAAIKLGIEAMKRVKKERDIQGALYNYELLGETKP